LGTFGIQSIFIRRSQSTRATLPLSFAPGTLSIWFV